MWLWGNYEDCNGLARCRHSPVTDEMICVARATWIVVPNWTSNPSLGSLILNYVHLCPLSTPRNFTRKPSNLPHFIRTFCSNSMFPAMTWILRNLPPQDISKIAFFDSGFLWISHLENQVKSLNRNVHGASVAQTGRPGPAPGWQGCHRRWLGNPRKKWRYLAGKTIYIYINK